MIYKMSQTKTNYEEWSKWYDIIYNLISPNDLEFYKSFMTSKTKNILEMGIGTGRVPLSCLENKVNWIGVDDSQDMLNVCESNIKIKQPLQGIITLIKEDMKKLDIRENNNATNNKLHDLVIYPSYSLMNAGTENNQTEALCIGSKHLNKDGLLIFDLHNPNLYKPNKKYSFVIKKILNKQSYEIYSKSEVDYKKRIHKNYLKIKIKDLSVELFSIENFLYIEDVIRITDEIGLEIIDIFGDYHKGKYDENSNEMIFICKKRKFY